MAKRDPRLQLRGSTYHVRIRVPDALRSVLGRREYRKSLGTGSLGEARRLLPIELVRINAEIAAAKRRLEGRAPVTATPGDLTQLAVQLLHRLQSNQFANAQRIAAGDGADLWFSRGGRQADIAGCEQWIEDLLDRTPASEAEVTAWVRSFLEVEHIEVATDAEFATLVDYARRAELEHARRTLRSLRGDHSTSEGDALFEGVRGDAPLSAPEPPPITLDLLLKRWRNEPSQRKLSFKSKLKATAQDRLLRELLGPDKAVEAVTRQDAARVVDVLAELPSNATKRWPKATALEAIELGKAAGVEPMSRTTARAYLTAFVAFMNFAVTRGVRGDNPAIGLSVGTDRVRAKDRRHPFSTAQLKAIFDTPLYRGCKDDEHGYNQVGPNIARRGRFWVPLLALHHGLRLNEACQLHVSDVADRDGTMVILIRTAGDDGGETDKRVKTEAGERFVPLHPAMIEMGFLAYLGDRRKSDDSRLFPELKPGSTGYLSDAFSKWFARFLEKAGAKRPRTSFHSFRHCYRDALRRAETPVERVRALGGWSSGETQEAYGSGFSAAQLAADMAKVTFLVDLSHLHVATKD